MISPKSLEISEFLIYAEPSYTSGNFLYNVADRLTFARVLDRTILATWMRKPPPAGSTGLLYLLELSPSPKGLLRIAPMVCAPYRHSNRRIVRFECALQPRAWHWMQTQAPYKFPPYGRYDLRITKVGSVIE